MMESMKMVLIGEPQISKFDITEEGVDVEVVIACRPAIDLGDYSALVPEITKPAIDDAAVVTRIEELASAQAPLVNVEEDRALANGDTALIDFEGFVDGEAFEGGKAEGFALRLGSGQFIPGFEDQVIGMKKGDESTIDVTFPENYGGAKLAGKAAQFKVKVLAIQTKENVELNDELAKKIKDIKKELPYNLNNIGVVTALEGAALKDFLYVLMNGDFKGKIYIKNGK